MFGYKIHTKADMDLCRVRDLETTAASVHNSRVDLSLPGEVVYRDNGYRGVEPRDWDAAMRRGVRGHPLRAWDRRRNQSINNRRAPVEKVFAVLKRVFDAGYVLMTTVERVHVKIAFSCLCFYPCSAG